MTESSSRPAVPHTNFANRVDFANGKWYRLEDGGDKVQLNSGIAIGWDIGPAVGLIRRYPLSPKVSVDFRDE